MKKKNLKLIKKFLPYYKPHMAVFLLDLFCAFGVAVAAIAFPILIRVLLYECFLETGIVVETLIIIVGAMLVLRVFEAICTFYMISYGHIMGAKIEAAMREKLYKKLLYLQTSFYDNTQTGDLMSRVNNDLFEITELSHHCPEEVFLACVKLIGSFIYLSFINLYLTLIMFCLLPPLIIFAAVLNKKMRKTFLSQRVKISDINSQLEDSLTGISVVKSFANEDVELKKFCRENDEFVAVKRKSYNILGIFHSSVGFASGLMYLLAVAFGAWFIALGSITTIDLITYLLFVTTLLSTISVFMTYTEQFQRGMSGFDRFIEIVEMPVTIESAPNATKDVNFNTDIVFDNVTFAYDEKLKDVIRNLSLTIKNQEKVAIVGSSGAGKTTIANLIPRFYDTTAGDILIDGKKITEIDLCTLRENVGIVQQNVFMFYGSVEENIRFGKVDATADEVIAAAKRAGAHEFITQLENGYDTICGERGVKLSGGQKQRIAIARVFLKNPPILVLDEATSALDNESERIVMASLSELSLNRTTITIAHRLTTIKGADRIIVLGEDGIIEQGSHSQLLERGGEYAELYKIYS